MSLRVNHNVTAISSHSSLVRSSSRLEGSIQKISSGLRINHAADDAAGLTISEKMRSQIKGLNRAKLNAQDGMSMLQTAEGGLNETESILQRLRELAVQSSNDTLTTNDRLEIQKEVNSLKEAIDSIANSTEYNTKKLLDGSQTALVSSSSKYIKGVAVGSGVVAGDYALSMTVVQGGISQMQTTQIFKNKNTGELAQGNTRLEDIAEFYDEAGVFSLTTPQTLYATGNSENFEFTINGKMTLNELASTLQDALANTNALGLRNSHVSMVNTVQTGVSGMGGYLELVSGKVGEAGNFSIIGPQIVMDALGLSVTRESVNNVVIANVLSDDPNAIISATTSADRVSGILAGIDVVFDSTPAQVAGNGGIVEGLQFSAPETLSFEFQTGVSVTSIVTVSVSFAKDSRYSMNGIVAEINAQIAAVTGGNSGMAAEVVNGQVRLNYRPEDGRAPTGIKVNAGSNTIGIPAGDYIGFIDGQKNSQQGIKGFSLLTDSSKVSAGLTIRITDGKNATIDVSVGVTISAGPDLVEINEWLTTWNRNIEAATVAARLDEVNGSLAITSTYLGDYNSEDVRLYQSLLTVESLVSTVNTAITSMDIFGYKDCTAIGDGDTNFRVHIKDSSPKYHIGANEGQKMPITICDMSTKALGIDKLDMTTKESSQMSLRRIEKALSTVSGERSKLGAYMNRLEYTSNNLENARTNMTDSESRIRDVDMALEMTEFSAAQVMQQAGTAMLAQANALSQNVLSLLQ